jgi:hypothetical protein
MKACVPNGNALADLRFLGVHGDGLSFTQCQIAYILEYTFGLENGGKFLSVDQCLHVWLTAGLCMDD